MVHLLIHFPRNISKVSRSTGLVRIASDRGNRRVSKTLSGPPISATILHSLVLVLESQEKVANFLDSPYTLRYDGDLAVDVEAYATVIDVFCNYNQGNMWLFQSLGYAVASLACSVISQREP